MILIFPSNGRAVSGAKRLCSLLVTVAVLLAFSPWARAELPEWVGQIEAGSPLQEVFFRPVELPKGALLARLPPRETRSALGALIQSDPANSRLYALRAREAERQLDFSAAESDWESYARTLGDPVVGQRALADFYHRRLRPASEVNALIPLTQLPLNQLAEEDSRLPAREQLAWRTFERIFQIIEAHALPAALAEQQYSAWVERYPNEADVRQRFFHFLLDESRFGQARDLLSGYERAFPKDQVFAVRARAALIGKSQPADDVFAYYREAFDPHWPLELIRDYFDALERAIPRETILDRLRAAADEVPGSLRAAARVFYFHQRRADIASAKEVLIDFREKKGLRGECWKAEDLLVIAGLFARVYDHPQAARYSLAAYLSPESSQAGKKQGLAGLLDALIAALREPRPTPLGADPYELSPEILLEDSGFWDEVQLLSRCEAPSAEPPLQATVVEEPSVQEPAAVAEEPPAEETTASEAPRRWPLSEIFSRFDRKFPGSEQGDDLRLRFLYTYAVHFQSPRVATLGEEFLASSQDRALRAEAALILGDAYALGGRTSGEFPLYERLLIELSESAGGMPLGVGSSAAPATLATPRSPEYARLLERTIERLSATGQASEIPVLFRREIERNPRDPGLHARLVAFLEQSRTAVETEQAYRRALQTFGGVRWYRELARWYLRQQNAAAFQELSAEVIRNLPHAEVAAYLEEVDGGRALGPQVYLRLNLLAGERFPFDLGIVRRLVSAYERDQPTPDDAAWERLLRRYWFHDDELRSRLFSFLSRGGRLRPEAEELRASLPHARSGRWLQLVRENPAAAQFLAEVETSESRFESAIPLLLALANDFPTDQPVSGRASSVLQTIALANPLYMHIVFGVEDGLHYAEPRDLRRLAHLGDLWADRQQFERAAPYWEQMAQVEPGRPESYLEAAAAFTRYHLYDEALGMLGRGRDQFPGRNGLYAYESGAIYEKKNDYVSALARYLQGVIAEGGGRGNSDRIAELARHPQYRELVRQSITQLAASQNPEISILLLQVSVLEVWRQRETLERFLLQLTGDTTSPKLLTAIRQIAETRGIETAVRRAWQRQAELAAAPAEELRARLPLLQRLLEQRDHELAARLRDQLYREHAASFSAVRADADSLWLDQQYGQAFALLRGAARDAYPAMTPRATFEAARAAASVGGYAQARLLLDALLADDPFEVQYLNAMAQSYVGEGSPEALALFDLATTARIDNSPLPSGEQALRHAALDRIMIDALEGLGNQGGALDRHIALIERDPADDHSIAEAARHAARHDLWEELARHYDGDHGPADDPRLHQIAGAKLRHYLEGRLPREVGTPDAATRADRLASLLPEDLPAPPPPVQQEAGRQTPTPQAEVQQAGVRQGRNTAPASSAAPATSPAGSGRREPVARGLYCIQIGAFKDVERATGLATHLERHGFSAWVASGDGYERVLVGEFKTWTEATAMERDLRNAGFETWIRRVPSTIAVSVGQAVALRQR